MNELAHIAAVELVRFLSDRLPRMSEDWWQERVLSRLSDKQKRSVQGKGHQQLEDLDLAGLLRVLDQNWADLSREYQLPWEGKTWTNELRSARNRWAHASAKAVPPSDTYRDADTLTRLLEVLDARPESRANVEQIRDDALAEMAPKNMEHKPNVRKTSSAGFVDARSPRREGYGWGRRGKYKPLQEALQARNSDEWRTTFSEIEEIIEDSLPPSARKYEIWWANDGNAQHSQKKAWGGAGWYIASVSLIHETVVFRRLT